MELHIFPLLSVMYSVINELIGDGTGKVVKAGGLRMKRMQTGRIQSYMIVSFVVLLLFALLYYFLMA